MRSKRLRWLVRAEGPFASVYFDDSHDTADAADELDTRWHDIQKDLVARGANAELVDTLKEACLLYTSRCV